jgi:23S rRNA (guanosine2251-2'-O)-methyltransferase
MSKISDNERYVYGKNPVKEELKIIKTGVLFLQKGLTPAVFNELSDKARSKNIEISVVDRDYFNKYFGDKNHQGIVLKINEEYNKPLSEDGFVEEIKNLDTDETVVILDGIKDVGNFGAILRSALLFGINYVVLPKDNSVPVNDIVVKRSSGAASFLKIVYVTNISRILEFLKTNGFWIYAIDKDGENLKKTRFSGKKALVLGEEGKGIRPLVKKNCDFVISIPTNDKLDSLNVSVSAGIVLFSIFDK